MILKLAAEDFSNSFGLSLYDNNNLQNEINLKSIDLSVDVLNKLKKWYKSYYIYTGMNETELEKYKKEIDELDTQGIEILKEVALDLKNICFEKTIYYSRGLDKKLVEINW